MFYLLLRFLGEENASGHLTDADYRDAVLHLAKAHGFRGDGQSRWKQTRDIF